MAYIIHINSYKTTINLRGGVKMEDKDIDINDEEQILIECDFDFFYNCEFCSYELCMFYNDILCKANKLQSDFNIRSALIDLGRIAITFNKIAEVVKELEEALKKANTNNYLSDYSLVEKENQQLKLLQNEKAIEVLIDISKTIRLSREICGSKASDLDIVSAYSYNRCLDDMKKNIKGKIEELRGVQ